MGFGDKNGIVQLIRIIIFDGGVAGDKNCIVQLKRLTKFNGEGGGG